MDILILNWKDIKNPDVGGAEIILYEIAKRLISQGHHVTWFCRSFNNCLNDELLDTIHVIRRGGILSVYFEAFKYYISLKQKPDKVIDCLNTICWQTPLYIPNYKRIFYVNQLAREVFFSHLPPIISHVCYFLENIQFLAYKKTKTICYSKSTKQDLIDIGFSDKFIHLFSLGLDHNRYQPGQKSKTPLFVFVARLVAMKRPDLCVKAMKIVLQKYPEAKLAVVGYGPMEEKLKSLIRINQLKDSVFLVNKNNLFFDKNIKDVKVKYLQEAWALLLPSVKEGWGMVVTEAASCKTPAIVTNVSGLKDSVIDTNTGLIISKNPSPDELAASMERIITDKKLTKDLSDNAYKNCLKYTWDKSYTEFFGIINHV